MHTHIHIYIMKEFHGIWWFLVCGTIAQHFTVDKQHTILRHSQSETHRPHSLRLYYIQSCENSREICSIKNNTLNFTTMRPTPRLLHQVAKAPSMMQRLAASPMKPPPEAYPLFVLITGMVS